MRGVALDARGGLATVAGVTIALAGTVVGAPRVLLGALRGDIGGERLLVDVVGLKAEVDDLGGNPELAAPPENTLGTGFDSRRLHFQNPREVSRPFGIFCADCK